MDYNTIPNAINDFDIAIGQEEEDFEVAFNQIFTKKNHIINDVQEECHDFEKKIYYLKNNISCLAKEEPNQIAHKFNFLKSDKKFLENVEIEEEKSSIKKTEEKLLNKENEKNNNIIELKENNENNGGDIKSDENINIIESKKNESNNIITIDIDKQNKFRVYSLNDFNLFHPGGTSEYYKQLKEELNDEICKQLKEETKLYFIISKSNKSKEMNKKTKKKT